ncbi:hypothetical protein DL93DRAFT_2096202 [Clavulina sp. PMI_390]|nr:hypothetical protein DL93DRAFT_2096202 [Clavulina sp. PMI_390]
MWANVVLKPIQDDYSESRLSKFATFLLDSPSRASTIKSLAITAYLGTDTKRLSHIFPYTNKQDASFWSRVGTALRLLTRTRRLSLNIYPGFSFRRDDSASQLCSVLVSAPFKDMLSTFRYTGYHCDILPFLCAYKSLTIVQCNGHKWFPYEPLDLRSNLDALSQLKVAAGDIEFLTLLSQGNAAAALTMLAFEPRPHLNTGPMDQLDLGALCRRFQVLTGLSFSYMITGDSPFTLLSLLQHIAHPVLESVEISIELVAREVPQAFGPDFLLQLFRDGMLNRCLPSLQSLHMIIQHDDFIGILPLTETLQHESQTKWNAATIKKAAEELQEFLDNEVFETALDRVWIDYYSKRYGANAATRFSVTKIDDTQPFIWASVSLKCLPSDRGVSRISKFVAFVLESPKRASRIKSLNITAYLHDRDPPLLDIFPSREERHAETWSNFQIALALLIGIRRLRLNVMPPWIMPGRDDSVRKLCSALISSRLKDTVTTLQFTGYQGHFDPYLNAYPFLTTVWYMGDYQISVRGLHLSLIPGALSQLKVAFGGIKLLRSLSKGAPAAVITTFIVEPWRHFGGGTNAVRLGTFCRKCQVLTKLSFSCHVGDSGEPPEALLKHVAHPTLESLEIAIGILTNSLPRESKPDLLVQFFENKVLSRCLPSLKSLHLVLCHGRFPLLFSPHVEGIGRADHPGSQWNTDVVEKKANALLAFLEGQAPDSPLASIWIDCCGQYDTYKCAIRFCADKVQGKWTVETSQCGYEERRWARECMRHVTGSSQLQAQRENDLKSYRLCSAMFRTDADRFMWANIALKPANGESGENRLRNFSRFLSDSLGGPLCSLVKSLAITIDSSDKCKPSLIIAPSTERKHTGSWPNFQDALALLTGVRRLRLNFVRYSRISWFYSRPIDSFTRLGSALISSPLKSTVVSLQFAGNRGDLYDFLYAFPQVTTVQCVGDIWPPLDPLEPPSDVTTLSRLQVASGDIELLTLLSGGAAAAVLKTFIVKPWRPLSSKTNPDKLGTLCTRCQVLEKLSFSFNISHIDKTQTPVLEQMDHSTLESLEIGLDIDIPMTRIPRSFKSVLLQQFLRDKTLTRCLPSLKFLHLIFHHYGFMSIFFPSKKKVKKNMVVHCGQFFTERPGIHG